MVPSGVRSTKYCVSPSSVVPAARAIHIKLPAARCFVPDERLLLASQPADTAFPHPLSPCLLPCCPSPSLSLSHSPPRPPCRVVSFLIAPWLFFCWSRFVGFFPCCVSSLFTHRSGTHTHILKWAICMIPRNAHGCRCSQREVRRRGAHTRTESEGGENRAHRDKGRGKETKREGHRNKKETKNEEKKTPNKWMAAGPCFTQSAARRPVGSGGMTWQPCGQ